MRKVVTMVVVSADSPLKGIADVGGSDEEEEEDEVGVWADVWVCARTLTLLNPHLNP